MKQLASISKQKKLNPIQQSSKPPNEEQQQNFIFNINSESNESYDEPPQEQILRYAQIIGIKLPEESNLLYIAKEGLMVDLPPDWEIDQLSSGQIIYINSKTKEKNFQHPCDQFFRQKVINQRKRNLKKVKGISKLEIPKSKASFNSNFMKKENDKIESQYQQNFKAPSSFFQKTPIVSKNVQLYNDEESEPSLNRKSQLKSSKAQPTLQFNPRPQRSFHPPPSLIKKNNKNQVLLAQKKKQIERQIMNKYKQKVERLQKQNGKKMNEILNRSKVIDEMDDEEFEQKYIDKINAKKKQIQRELLLEHVKKLRQMKQKKQDKYQNDIIKIQGSTNLQGLFQEMGNMKKMLKKDKRSSQIPKFMEQFAENSLIINQLEVSKTRKQVQSKMRAKMLEILQSIDRKQQPDKIYKQIQNKKYLFTTMFEELLKNDHIKQVSNSINENQKKQILNKIEKQQEIQINLYSQLQQLKEKLKNIKIENQSQRGQLSDRQNKLFDLLQNRVGLSSRSGSD